MYFRNLFGLYHFENNTKDSLVNGFQSIWDHGRFPKKLQTDKGTEFLHGNFQSLLKKIASISLPQGKCGRTFQSRLENSYVEIFYAKNTRVYTDTLQDILLGCNNSYHQIIGRVLVSVSLHNTGQMRRELYGKSRTKPR